MKKTLIYSLSLVCCVAMLSCKKKSSKASGPVDVPMVDFEETVVNTYTIKGKVPKWEKSAGFGGVSVFMFKDKNEMVLAKIQFSSIKSGDVAPDKFADVVKEKFSEMLKPIAGQKGEQVEAPAKVREGVYSYVIKRKDGIMKGDSYEVTVPHLVKFRGKHFALSCGGWARGDKVELWKTIKKVCSEMVYSEVKKPEAKKPEEKKPEAKK
ncbi:hypothetical protein KJ865_00385 [Myxococcota bacterium]|nr:hypothetical protein [Myxococcota bacterium]